MLRWYFFSTSIEVVALADDGLEAELRLIDKLVPIEGINDLQVALPQFDEFLLELALHLGDAPGS
jgi:hypothetical protein